VTREKILNRKETKGEGDDFEELFRESLAAALGVRADVLSPLDRLIVGLQDAGMDDAAWLQFVEDAAESLPELFDPAEADALAKDLEAAMGTAVVIGVRKQIRETPNEKDQS
jgi:hypothetical protein